MKLLNIDANPKTVKGRKQGYMTAVLYLAPYTLAGINVCPMAELAGCVHACLNTAGRAGIVKKGETTNRIQQARINRTRLYAYHRQTFTAQLVKELQAFIRKAERAGLVPAIRLNGTSDIRWENHPVEVDGVDYDNLMRAFPGVIFYDYTKIPNRKRIPANYKLTFSYSAANPRYEVLAKKALQNGLNVAVVFRKDLPDSFLQTPVINGDENDLRFTDPNGVIVGLKAKGPAKKDETGFVVDAS